MKDQKKAEQGPLGLVKKTFGDFMEDDCPRMAAALSYYTVFSLPALLILILMIAGTIWNPQEVEQALTQQAQGLVGEEGAAQIASMIRSADRPGTGGPLATVLSIAALLFGATGAFIQLQQALNKAWEVEPDPEAGGLKNFVFKRLLSLGMVLGIAFLLLVSLALSAALSAFGQFLGNLISQGVSSILLQVLSFALSFAVITLLFAALFRVLPDAEIAWKQVWFGAAVTALLFTLGKLAIGVYLGQSNPGEAFGAAGSLAVILIWVYFSAMILFLGAEFTQVWAQRHGEPIEPSEGAVRVVEERRHIRAGEEA